MNKFFKPLSILALIVVLTLAYGAQVAQASEPVFSYESLLGKPLDHKNVAEFVARNECTSAGSFQVCQEAGMALWLDGDQTVKSVYLYPTSTQGFTAYKGELPLGLAATDTMAIVEQKFGHPKVQHAPQAGWEAGLPDEGGSPDHLHYWAIYRRFGVTVIYDSPSEQDKNARVIAIIRHE